MTTEDFFVLRNLVVQARGPGYKQNAAQLIFAFERGYAGLESFACMQLVFVQWLRGRVSDAAWRKLATAAGVAT